MLLKHTKFILSLNANLCFSTPIQEETICKICYLESAKEATLQPSCGALHLPIPLVDICV